MTGPILAACLLGSALPNVTLRAIAGEVKIRHDGHWHAAKQGDAIAADDLLSIPVGARATVALPGGELRDLQGSVVCPGRRLASAREAAVLLSSAVRDAARASLDADRQSTAAAIRGDEVEAARHRRLRHLTFMGEAEEESHARVSDADFAESQLRLGDDRAAVDHAWLVVSDPDAPPLDAARAHLVLARIELAASELEAARHELDLAAIETYGPRSAEIRAQALALRGQTLVQLGEDGAATRDLEAALALTPDGREAAEASFFLGALALAHDDATAARARFAALARFPELARSADELLRASTP